MTDLSNERLEPVAWLRDLQPEAEDEALAVCWSGDPGAFPVYAAPPSQGEPVAVKGLTDYDVLFSCLETFWCLTTAGTDDRLLAEGAIDAAKRIRSALSPAPSLAVSDELAEIEAMLSAGQGDDDGMQILPDFEPDMSTAAKVESCLELLEKRRDILSALRHAESREPALRLSEQDRQLMRMIVPSVEQRSREPGDAWNEAAAVLWLLIDDTAPIAKRPAPQAHAAPDVWKLVGECLAGMDHKDVSERARRKIEAALTTAMSASHE